MTDYFLEPLHSLHHSHHFRITYITKTKVLSAQNKFGFDLTALFQSKERGYGTLNLKIIVALSIIPHDECRSGI